MTAGAELVAVGAERTAEVVDLAPAVVAVGVGDVVAVEERARANVGLEAEEERAVGKAAMEAAKDQASLGVVAVETKAAGNECKPIALE